MINLGDKVRARISKLEGIVTARSEYLFSVPQVLVTPTVCENGKPVSGTWFEESAVEIIAEGLFEGPSGIEYVKRRGFLAPRPLPSAPGDSE